MDTERSYVPLLEVARSKAAGFQRQLCSEQGQEGSALPGAADPPQVWQCLPFGQFRELGNARSASTTHRELPEIQKEIRETQCYHVIPSAEAAREGTHQKSLFHAHCIKVTPLCNWVVHLTCSSESWMWKCVVIT